MVCLSWSLHQLQPALLRDNRAAYSALRDHIGLLGQVIECLSPILARMLREISDADLADGGSPDAWNITHRIKR